jgi:hypothetical protein
MAGYTKEFLVDAFMSRYEHALDAGGIQRLRTMTEKLYDEVGKDKMRVWCSLDADAIKTYKNMMLTAKQESCYNIGSRR